VSPVRYELGFYIPDDGTLHSHCHENIKSYISRVYLKCQVSLPYPVLLSSVYSLFHSSSLSAFSELLYVGTMLFMPSRSLFADEEERQAANISVGEQDFKFIDFARR
jgi:hypothetical protein